MNKKISQILAESYDYQALQIEAAAKILHYFGSLDGVIKSFHPNQKQIAEILDFQITEEALNALFQTNIFHKFRGFAERHEVPKILELRPLKAEIIQDFKILGFIDELSPQKQNYDAIFIFGANIGGMEERIAATKYFEKKSGKNLSDKVVALAGERDLWLDYPTEKSLATKLILKKIAAISQKIISTEEVNFIVEKIHTQNFELSLDQRRAKVVAYFQNEFSIKFPSETDAIIELLTNDEYFSNRQLEFINAPKKPNGARPDTVDTIIEWIKQNPNFGNLDILAISSQPFICAQLLPLKIYLPNCHCETVGFGTSAAAINLGVLASEFVGILNRKLLLEKRKIS
jgi:hypothetical protein